MHFPCLGGKGACQHEGYAFANRMLELSLGRFRSQEVVTLGFYECMHRTLGV